MEQILRNRLKLRHNSLLEIIEKAEEVKKSSELGVTLLDLMEVMLKLKNMISLFERDCLKHAECSKELDQAEQDSFMSDQLRAEDLLMDLETIKNLYSQQTPSKQETCTKLPKLEIPKFNGDILKWPEFWDKFDANIHSRQLRNVDKLSYLFGFMEGPALEALSGIDVTNDNYDIALSTLRRRFGNTSLVIDAHYNALTKLPRATENDVRGTLDTIMKHLRILQAMGEDTTGNFLRNLICGKFPEKIIYELNLITPLDKDMAVILETLEKIVTAKERSMTPSTSGIAATSSTEVLQVRSVFINGNRKRKQEREKIQTQPFIKRARRECGFCQGGHFSDTCRTFSTYTQRIRALEGKCYRCFKTGHQAKLCKHKALCHYCNGQHHRALCRTILPKELRPPVNMKKTKIKGALVEKAPREKPSAKGKQEDDCYDAENTKSMYTYLRSYLQTATARIQYNDRTIPVRLLLDCGSQRSYMTTKLAQSLKLQYDQEDQLLIYTFGSEEPQNITSPSAEVTLVTKRGCEKLVRVNIIPHITDRVLVSQLNTREEVDIPADDDSLGEGIDLLIGNDYYFSFLKNKHIKIGENLYLVDTDLGWIVSGCTSEDLGNDLSLITYCQCHRSDCPYFSEPDLPLRSIDMKFLWSLESIGIVDSPKATREEEAVKYFNETITYHKGRYAVKWPWIQYPPEIPTNFGLALGRLRSLLKRADEQTLKDYKEIFSEQLKAGIIELVEPHALPTNQATPPVHYLPHHIVKQSGKKGRIVYDASARTKEEKSLNECMYRGPSMLEDLTSLLLKFRTGKVGITADVEKAFLQISLQEDDRDVTRFLWVKDTSKELLDSNLLHYRFCRVPFGIIASPFLLTATIRHHMSKTDEVLLKKIADRCYVDNLVTETKSLDAACELYQETRKAFGELSMNIRDWVSNDKDFMKYIPEEYKAKDCNEVKVLGLSWDLTDDTLRLKVPEFKEVNTPEKKTTKKDVLRTVARLYDPCGFASPLILPAKILFQETCIRKLKWNSILPSELQDSWHNILESLEAAKDIRIPRYIGSTMNEDNVSYELHCFSDASKNAYAAVVYILLRGTNNAVTAFLMSKSRITPIEDKSDLKIPRLELLGFLIGSRLLKYIAENLEIHIDKKYLWTDSLIVLAWMKTNKLLPPFVSRRVNEIKQNKEVELRYVPTQMNQADVATRPETMMQKAHLWFTGPEFLSKGVEDWPVQHCNEQQILFSAGEALDLVDGPEMAVKGYEDITNIPEELSDVTEEINIPQAISSDLNDDSDLNDETKLIKDLQANFYPEEVAGKQTSLARNLGLFLDTNGVLRCKGRLANTDWTYDMKYPILIPKDGEFTNKLIMQIHKKNYHVGVSHTLSLIRQRYWIPQGRAQVQKSLKKCPQCIKHGGGPYKLPPTPALPSERVNFSTPFSFTGMDYFGPMFVQTSSTKEKRWICLFTCLAVRAIHLELVNDLTAQECLMGLRRFIACRGKPNLIVSDNATQFKLTSEILADPHCVENGIRWKFIPQLAPWHGGVYERLIALVKSCLKRTLDKHLLQDGQLLTVIKEAEAVVNTRPLVRVGSEVEHVLRPADFLSLGRCLEISPSEKPHLEGTVTKIDLLLSWKKGQAILNEFKKMFHGQYLPSLRERYNQHPKQPRITSNRSPQIGDIVQIRDDSKNRNNWKVGKISALIKGQDGECRVAKVKVGDYELTRSVGHLYPLEAEIGEDEFDKLDVESGIESLTNQPELRDMMEVDLSEMPIQSQQIDKTSPDLNSEQRGTPEVLESVDTPPAGEETEIAEMDMEEDQLQPNEVDENEPVLRGRREAAIRARERIAEWTRHLLAIL